MFLVWTHCLWIIYSHSCATPRPLLFPRETWKGDVSDGVADVNADPDAALAESARWVEDERSSQLASDVMWRFEGKTGCRLWLRLLGCDSRSSSLGFSIIPLILAGRRVFHHRLQPSLSWFFFFFTPSQLLSWRGKSVGSQADHYKKTSPSPECLMVRQKSPDGPVFPHSCGRHIKSEPSECSGDLRVGMESSASIAAELWKSAVGTRERRSQGRRWLGDPPVRLSTSGIWHRVI